MSTAAHNFKELTAITYDDMTDTIYFNAKEQDAGTIVSLKLSHDKSKIPNFDTVVERTDHGSINGLAFDPLERVLYWTDSRNHTIFHKALAVDDAQQALVAENGTVWMKLTNDDRPMGISIDVCRRNVYWSNWAAKPKSSTLKRASMNAAAEAEVIVDIAGSPFGVTVDQFSKRLFWVDDLDGDDFVVSSSALDGTDRKNVVSETLNDPRNLAVDREYVYWTDMTHKTIWRAKKDGSPKPEQVPHNFTTTPNGIILRSSLLSAQANNEECSKSIAAIKARSKPTRETTTTLETPTTGHAVVPFCLNPMKDMPADRCVCAPGFVGDHCERSLCHNFCVHGECEVDSRGNPQCKCSNGYLGARCEQDVCEGYCLMGRCTAINSQPSCSCELSYYGPRCQHRKLPEVCRDWCDSKDDKYGRDLVKLCK